MLSPKEALLTNSKLHVRSWALQHCVLRRMTEQERTSNSQAPHFASVTGHLFEEIE